MKKLPLSLISLIVIVHTVSAQDTAAEIAGVRVAEKNAIDLYYHFIGRQARLYNGVDHNFYSPLIKGHPYFLSDSLQTGWVVYDNLRFENVRMLYDIYKDELMIRHYNGYKIKLLTEKIDSFDLAGHHFIRHVYDRTARSSLSTGFYDHLYGGKTPVLVRRAKLLDEKVTDVIVQRFLPNDSYYIFKDGSYHSCSSFRNLLSILQDHSRKVRRYLRKNKIRYRTNREQAVVRGVQFYDTLK